MLPNELPPLKKGSFSKGSLIFIIDGIYIPKLDSIYSNGSLLA
jgi:hypothetical protein